MNLNHLNLFSQAEPPNLVLRAPLIIKAKVILQRPSLAMSSLLYLLLYLISYIDNYSFK